MKSTGSYPRVHVDTAKVTAVGQAGGILLTETIRATGLDRALSEALDRWRKPLAVHDPGKIICDLALSLVLGGEALSNLATLRAEPGVYGPVASDPAVSRLIATLAQDADKAIKAITGARQQARARAWELAGEHAPNHAATAEDPVVIDRDASLITAHSEKQRAAPTFKRGFGFHPLMAFADHGPEGTGEALVVHLRPGNAGSNKASDHIAVPGPRWRSSPTATLALGAGSWSARTAPATSTSRSPTGSGSPPSTPTARHGRGRTWPTSPDCSTCRVGLPGCG
ncbi:hypothetical protein GCM10022275_23110 [Tessaracoccus defluvii]